MRERQSVAGRRARRTSEVRQAEIVAAVLELARDRGPDAITTQAIAERIGVTQGAVFRHFPHKEAIWLAVFAWVRASLDRVLEEAVDATRPPLANLERAFCAHVALVAAHPGLPRILYHELQGSRTSQVRVAVRDAVGSYRRGLARLFEQAKDAGEVAADLDTALATLLFIGSVQGLAIQAALAGRAMTARVASATFALLASGYRGTPAPRKRRA
jgi:TetR/AcrR family transcriptional regulator